MKKFDDYLSWVLLHLLSSLPPNILIFRLKISNSHYDMLWRVRHVSPSSPSLKGDVSGFCWVHLSSSCLLPSSLLTWGSATSSVACRQELSSLPSIVYTPSHSPQRPFALYVHAIQADFGLILSVYGRVMRHTSISPSLSQLQHPHVTIRPHSSCLAHKQQATLAFCIFTVNTLY